MARQSTNGKNNDSGLNFEAQLWAAADNWQESNGTTWKLARMNLAIRGIGANLSANSDDKNFDNLRRPLPQ